MSDREAAKSVFNSHLGRWIDAEVPVRALALNAGGQRELAELVARPHAPDGDIEVTSQLTTDQIVPRVANATAPKQALAVLLRRRAVCRTTSGRPRSADSARGSRSDTGWRRSMPNCARRSSQVKC